MIFRYIIFFSENYLVTEITDDGGIVLGKGGVILFFFLAEDPSKSYVKLRDFVLVKLCQDLPCFSRERLMQGFHEDMAIQAQQKFKINKVLFNFYFVGGKHLFFFKYLTIIRTLRCVGSNSDYIVGFKVILPGSSLYLELDSVI